MNHSIYSADRTTHLKIVVVGLVAAIGMAALSISSHIVANVASDRSAAVIKVGKPMIMTSSSLMLVR
jgi:hypothetical protein